MWLLVVVIVVVEVVVLVLVVLVLGVVVAVVFKCKAARCALGNIWVDVSLLVFFGHVVFASKRRSWVASML